MHEVSDNMARHSDDKSLGLPTKDQNRSLDALKTALNLWLQTRWPERQQQTITHLSMPSGSGLANETLLLEVQWQAAGESHRQDWVVRIETPDPLFPLTSARQQYLMNQALSRHTNIPVPRVFAYEDDRQWLGAPFYVMQRIAGKVPADDPPYHHSGWMTDLSTGERHALFTDAVRVMAELHRVDVDILDFMQPHSVTDGLRDHLQYYMTHFDRAADGPHPVIDAGRAWLLANFPAPAAGTRRCSLAWGDARVGNMIFAEGKCQAVLDWDMLSLAGAETDLAWWCAFDQTYTVSSGIARLPGMGTPAQMLALWESCAGRKVENFDWHLALAFYKCAVIVRRLARKLKQEGRLPAASAFMEYHNPGMQYLASYLGLATDYPITMPWPGLD